MIVEATTELENHHFANINVIIDTVMNRSKIIGWKIIGEEDIYTISKNRPTDYSLIIKCQGYFYNGETGKIWLSPGEQS